MESTQWIWHNEKDLWMHISVQVVVFEFENFQGCKAEFSSECKDVTEKGLEKVGSLIVDSGPWVMLHPVPLKNLCCITRSSLRS